MYFRSGKRIFDLGVGISLLILLSPFLVIISLLSAIFHGPHGVFFLQERVGYKRVPFKVIKFKTMTDQKDANGNLLPDEDRQTKWGVILRKFSMDELLQLINVIKGDMSIVGPRPLVSQQVSDLNGEELMRFEVRPGITGLAQVCGRNDLSFNHRFRYDAWYVHHLSPVLDFQILMMTVKVVISGYGVEYNPSIQDGIVAKK